MNIINLFLIFSVFSSLWSVGGRTIKLDKLDDSAFPAYACRLDLVAKTITMDDGKLTTKDLSFPCTSIVIEKKEKELKLLTAAHCLVNLDINDFGDKVYYHHSIPKVIRCPNRIDGKKVFYADYRIQDYSFLYDKRFLEEKASIIAFDRYGDKKETGDLSLRDFEDNIIKPLGKLKVNEEEYRNLALKVASLDLAVLTVRTDKSTYLIEQASMPESISKVENCMIAGYSKKKKLNAGEVSNLSVHKSFLDKMGYISANRKDQKSWVDFGDSGGPLFCEQKDGSWAVVGVTSNFDSILSRPTMFWSIADKAVVNRMIKSSDDQVVKINKKK